MKPKLLAYLSTVFLAAFALSGCNREQPVEVFIPPGGDPAQGRVVFVKFDCHECHSIPGIEMPPRVTETPVDMMLSRRMYQVRDFGGLMTAILYPSHAVSPKIVGALKAAGQNPDNLKMPVFADEMTVAELVDLLAFLDHEYSRNMEQYQSRTD